MDQTQKRVVPPVLRKILTLDEQLTEKFVLWMNKFVTFRSMKVHYKALEISCHGIPWLAFWIAFTWLFDNQNLVQMQVNIILGLLLDIILVALTKAYVRRRRPKAHIKDSMELGPDVFSFPSGHASRAVFVAYFFICLQSAHFIFYGPLIAWATSVSISRVLLNRHHILDVLAGVLLGLIEGVLVGWIYVDDSTAKWLMNYLSDEKLDGGDYHV
ncbi:polyisoprenoid diphosphate/phosphate phosphohydrolase PLPP6 [Onthophagus taurus]|uniref:polyisoprenoid diphosphate/phosphate phosphohydrolase PLPP6 n=1 Tax=Onthophagus taurus TaxID=166361 RepID=UPI000C2031CD|nr:phospholipid phosphatase 6 [Onthophagus taurus]